MVDVSDENPADDSADTDGVAAGVEQFQKAALDALRAARAMIDAAESIVSDPKAIESVIATVADAARDATRTVAGFAAAAARSATDDGPGDDDDESGFETIDIG